MSLVSTELVNLVRWSYLERSLIIGVVSLVSEGIAVAWILVVVVAIVAIVTVLLLSLWKLEGLLLELVSLGSHLVVGVIALILEIVIVG
jgi:hypothetical protein